MAIRSLSTRLTMLMMAVALLLTLGTPMPSFAQMGRPKNMIQKHPTLTGIAAGVGTRAALKASARRKKARGQRLNFAERHPTMSGIGAGIATRHIIKKHTPKY